MGADAVALYVEQAKEAQRQSGVDYGRGGKKVPSDLTEPLASPHERETRTKAAKHKISLTNM